MMIYRTAKGSKAHASYSCANNRRAITSGDVVKIPADQAKDWTPCKHCTTPELRVAWGSAPKAAAKPEMCPNTGVKNPRHIQSECRDCGKRGTVNRNTGSLKAHKPAA